jgi:hypothetical protein
MESREKMLLVNMPLLKEKLKEREAFVLARQRNPALTPEAFIAETGKRVSQSGMYHLGIMSTPHQSKAAVSLGRSSKHSHKRSSKRGSVFPRPMQGQAEEEAEGDPFVKEFKVMAAKLEQKHNEALMEIKIERIKQIKEEAKHIQEAEKQAVDKIIMRRMKFAQCMSQNDPNWSPLTSSSPLLKTKSKVSLSKVFRASQTFQASNNSQNGEEGTAVFFRMNKLADNILPKTFINDSLQMVDPSGQTVGSEKKINSVDANSRHDTKKLQIIFEKKQLQRSVVTPSTPSTSPFLLRTAKIPGTKTDSFRISTLANDTRSMLECLKEPAQADLGWSHRYQNTNESVGLLTDRVKLSEGQESNISPERKVVGSTSSVLRQSTSLGCFAGLTPETKTKRTSRPKLEKISDSVLAKLRLKMQEKQKLKEHSSKSNGSVEVQYLERAGFPVFKVKDQSQFKSRYTSRDRANIHGGTILLNQPTEIGLMGNLPFPIQIFKRE